MNVMGDDIINFDLPIINQSIIKVIGVGGGGGNAVNYMHRMGIKDVDFVLCNTDAQALVNSPVEFKVQLGATLTEGRGAGNKPEIGRQAAIESLQQIVSLLQKNTKMVFITAGIGGGTALRGLRPGPRQGPDLLLRRHMWPVRGALLLRSGFR